VSCAGEKKSLSLRGPDRREKIAGGRQRKKIRNSPQEKKGLCHLSQGWHHLEGLPGPLLGKGKEQSSRGISLIEKKRLRGKTVRRSDDGKELHPAGEPCRKNKKKKGPGGTPGKKEGYLSSITAGLSL